MSTFNIQIKLYYVYQVEITIVYKKHHSPKHSHPSDDLSQRWDAPEPSSSLVLPQDIKDIKKGQKGQKEQNWFYQALVLDPPGSFWDNRKKFESDDLNSLIESLIEALDQSVEQQLNV